MRTIAIALLLSVSFPAVAEKTNDTGIDEIIVSVTRRALGTSDISATTGIVDSDTIKAGKLLSDALAETPGVFLQQTTPGQGAAVIRGLKGSSILHLVDGMRLNNAIFRSAPTQYLSLVPLTAVERIESIRGTPTSLYGSDAVGGIVNVVTRVPSFDTERSQTSGELFAATDSAEKGRTVRATFDIGNRDVATSVSIEALKTGNRKTGGGKRISPSGYTSNGGRYVLAITPDDKRTWIFDIQYLEQPSTPRIDELVAGFGQSQPSSQEFAFMPNRRIFAHARYDHRKGANDIDWRFDLGFQQIDDDRRTRDFGSATRRYETNRSDLLGATLTAGKTSEGRSWVAGIEAYHDRVRSSRVEEDVASGTRQATASRYPDGATLDLAAIYANSDTALGDRSVLSGGLRVSSVSVDLPGTPAAMRAAVKTTDISGDLGWRFDADEHWQLIANLGYGFRAPNIFDLGTLGNRPGNRFNIPNTALDSEHVIQVDAGVRFHSDHYRFEFIGFILAYDDRITSVLTGGTTTDGRDIVQSVNAADSEIHGLEFAASIVASKNLRLDTTITYTKGEQRIANDMEPADRIPPLLARLSLEYDRSDSVSLSAWLHIAGAQRRLSARDRGDARIDPAGTPGWAIVGGNATWQSSGGWTVQAGVDNLLDRRYRTHGSGIDATGRNVSASVSYAW